MSWCGVGVVVRGWYRNAGLVSCYSQTLMLLIKRTPFIFTVTRFYDFTNLHKTAGKRLCAFKPILRWRWCRGAGLVRGAGWCVVRVGVWCGVGVVVRGWYRNAGLVSCYSQTLMLLIKRTPFIFTVTRFYDFTNLHKTVGIR
ncbi:hypothetical protein [Bartonella krasnovii]|uniref:hypothetical protein n=1 Tax=Bartonella krasnovii TaxID=2267275 RepID=UPI001F4CF90E|nr:hypothetical protein [Bartonella krasnovii]UNF46788.1 hypothetical protein MNL05_06940 [Bartonella krasnovii]